MTFPIESETGARRRILDICKDHARSVVDITRELALMFDAYVEGKSKAVKMHYNNMSKLMDEKDKLKNNLIGEVVSVGSLLISREDFLRLIFQMGEVADTIEAMGFRLSGVTEQNWKLDNKYMTKASELWGLVLKEVSKVRETLHSLGFDPEKTLGMAKSVEDLEKQIDTFSRTFDLELMGSKLQQPSLLFFRDVVDRAERIADMGVDVVDHIRVLALTA